MRAPEPIEVVRIVATPAALDATDWPDGLIAARIAQDEILLLGGPPPEVPDPHALVEDDHGFSAVGLSTADGHWRAGFAFRHLSNLSIRTPNNAVDFKGIALEWTP